MKKLRKASLFIWLPVFILIGYNDTANAVNGTLKQQILPLDCVYQIVNDGTGTIVYLTPNECGVLPTPTVNTPLAPTEPTAGQQVITIIDSGPAIFQVPFVPVSSDSPESSQTDAVVAGVQFLPYEQLTTVEKNTNQAAVATGNTSSVFIPAPIAIMGISALILLILLVFF